MTHFTFTKFRSSFAVLAVVLFLLVAPTTTHSSEPAKLKSLEDFLERAFAENPQLTAFEQRYQAAMQRIPQAASLPDPKLQITHFVESVQTRTGPQENVITLSQTLPWFGKLSRRKEAASLEAEALWFAYQDQQLKLARAVSVAYYEYGYLEQAIRLSRENRDLLQKLEPIVEAKVKGGADLNALLRLKVEIGKVDDRLQTLKQKKVAQSAKLGELLAMPEADSLPSPDWEAPDGSLPDRDSLVTDIRTNNPELQMIERQVASAQARHEIARLEAYPDVTLGLNYIQIDDPSVNPMTPDAGQDPWGVSIAINIPIWYPKYNAAKAEALADKRAVESKLDHRWNELRALLSASLARMQDATRRLELYGNELLGLAEQAVKNSRTSYEGGRTGILEVIDSERSLLDLQLLYWRAAADAWQQRITIRTLAGQGARGTGLRVIGRATEAVPPKE
ncbi:TolC family protein [Coraliomargarita sinensis]|uniref:TolC family protein n=1 Tax=Coraliomargarita sinensis TaxID=2174842 RepID=A0A317ZFP7_9BACT|nr:TolC family protein [Coraliomargarita sinensis]PXA03013.1 TolC family protein [Coraliomargarita sinensis]